MKPNFPEDQLLSTPSGKIPKLYSCAECRNGAGLDFSFTMAFQPIIDWNQKNIYSHEALVRGTSGESAYSILSKVNSTNRYQFDQACRIKAIQLASQIGIPSYLNINFLPNAVYQPETCIRTTLEASQEYQFPLNRLVFELTEGEEVQDHDHIINIFKKYKEYGFLTAIDDFGSGYSGLNLLAKFQPDLIKLDMELIRNIHTNSVAQKLTKAIAGVCHEIGIKVIAEGVETIEELKVLVDMGISLYQGYLFSKPAFESAGEVVYPTL
ncbi:EAL domain-containing protein [Leptospira kanakyensis]|uniref:EAL domain-containing protein n=1 Tax=Leptospira kanakyensis TaxID=2484968 RepID=UPI00223DC56B|nr:EAL domain-containing protein [Leptospira kanakyensis]MCW7469437.1 EAL domain-containing protein [Leptospira kanakyensis]